MLISTFCRAGLLAACTLAAPAAFAQTAQTAPANQAPRGGYRADMFKELNLTADQQAKVEALMRESRPAERPSGPPTDAERQAMQARRTEMDTKLKDILTPEQYTKYQAMRPQRGQRPSAQ